MKVLPVEIKWNPRLPIFASEPFLRAVGDEYGWLGGLDQSGQLRCILPYTIIRKLLFRFVRFRVETIHLAEDFDISQEKAFLNSCIDFFRSIKTDVIIPATTNCVFRTYPDGAIPAPYGTYIIDLDQPEESLWRNIKKRTRQDINRAINIGVAIKETKEELKPAYNLIRATFKRSRLPFMSYNSFERFVNGLGQYSLILKAEYQNIAQSYVVFGFSECRAYAIYAGNASNIAQGANKLLLWESIRHFKKLGVKTYDFYGTRINPSIGSKQEALSTHKRHFGARLVQGYIWKYQLNKAKYYLYCLAAKLRSGGDIVDAEKHKMADFKPEKKEDLYSKDDNQ